MTNLKDRVLQIVDYKGVARSDFFKEIGVSYSNFKGKSKESGLSSDTLAEISSYFPDVNIAWLLKGEGEMLINSSLNKNPPTEVHGVTGYYFPDVTTSAGLEQIFENSESTKVPVSIPNFGRDIHFINVFGDSMHPMYIPGEIVGIKKIEFQFLQFGFVYVIFMTDGESYLKYVKKGKDEQHVLLVSENEHYEPREFHISLIRSFHIVKGSIRKYTI